MKTILVNSIIILALFITGSAFSQTFEEFKKQREQEFQQFKAEETRKMKELQKDFDAFVEERDKEFVEYLEKEWEAFNVSIEMEAPEAPKPDVIPKYKPQERQQLDYKAVPVILSDISVPREKPKNLAIPVIQKSEIEHFEKSDLIFNYYGVKIYLDYDQELKINAPADINESNISAYWKEASKTNYNYLVNQLLDYKNTIGLNDWGYYLLVKKTVAEITLNDKNSSILLNWFLLNRSGYAIKIAYSNNETTLIIPTTQTIYGKKYLTIYGVNYYILEPLKTNVIHTYARDYHDATRFFDFRITRSMNLGNNVKDRTLRFNHNDIDYLIDVEYDMNAISFYKDYPHVNINVYFDAPLSKFAIESLAASLTPHVLRMNEGQSVNFLLDFVQTAFEYKKDPDQFGYEKFFFAEEVLFYPYSDCEDRSVLFAYLVRELLNMKVIGLGYDGHVATALHFSDQKNLYGSFVLYNDQKYTIADPTYINAPAGLTMPQYKNAQAKIIELASVNYSENTQIDFWALANKGGTFRGGNMHDIEFDDHGNAYITGYFSQNAQLGDIELTSDSPVRTAFIAKFDKYGKAQWAAYPGGEAVSTGFAIKKDNEQNILIAGSFNGQAMFKGYTLSSREGKPDVFLVKYDPTGKVMWASQARLDTIDQKSYLKYIAKYGRSGNHMGTDFYLEKVELSENGIFVDESGVNYLAGTLSETTGFKVAPQTFDFDTVDYPKIIKTESDHLISQNVERHIAAIVAVVNLIKGNGMVIPGPAMQATLDRYQPDFKDDFEDLYDLLGKIKLLKNAEGIVTIATDEGDPVLFDKVKVYDKAQLKMVSLQDGNEKMEFLSGVKVGKLFVWFKLNYVILLKDSGNMLFDYDKNHSQITMNLKEDIIGD